MKDDRITGTHTLGVAMLSRWQQPEARMQATQLTRHTGADMTLITIIFYSSSLCYFHLLVCINIFKVRICSRILQLYSSWMTNKRNTVMTITSVENLHRLTKLLISSNSHQPIANWSVHTNVTTLTVQSFGWRLRNFEYRQRSSSSKYGMLERLQLTKLFLNLNYPV